MHILKSAISIVNSMFNLGRNTNSIKRKHLLLAENDIHEPHRPHAVRDAPTARSHLTSSGWYIVHFLVNTYILAVSEDSKAKTKNQPPIRSVYTWHFSHIRSSLCSCPRHLRIWIVCVCVCGGQRSIYIVTWIRAHRACTYTLGKSFAITTIPSQTQILYIIHSGCARAPCKRPRRFCPLHSSTQQEGLNKPKTSFSKSELSIARNICAFTSAWRRQHKVEISGRLGGCKQKDHPEKVHMTRAR